MGIGIAAAIPIIIAPYANGWRKEVQLECFSSRFLDCYNYDAKSRDYTIKHDMLIENYSSFLTEFYDCIGENCAINEHPKFASYESFKEFFDDGKRNMKMPFIYEDSGMFSILGGTCPEYWLFYSGSRKVFLEVYSTLLHFERILVKAMKNPLAHAVKFGLFG